MLDLTVAGQVRRLQEAISSKWGTAALAAIDYGRADNYFSRSAAVSPEAAVWVQEQTGYRAAWILLGELPAKARDSVANAVAQATRAGMELAASRLSAAVEREAEALFREVRPVVVATSPERAEQILADAAKATGKSPKPAKKKQA